MAEHTLGVRPEGSLVLVTQNQVYTASVGTCVHVACRHVHTGEAAMTQPHRASSVCTCVDVSVCAGTEQKLLPPRGWGKWL